MSGTSFQVLSSQTSFQGDDWSLNTGSAVYSGSTGVQRVQFSTVNPGSYGNFIDGLFLNIAAFAEFTAGSYAAPESNTGNLPSLIINGRVDTLTTIPFTITGGTADSSDYAASASVVTVPPGNYRAVSFPLPITITDNFIPEPDETIEFSIGTPSTSEIVLAKTLCDGTAPQTTAIYTIINDDPIITSTKSVDIYDPGAVGLFSIPGNDVIYSLTTTNIGSVDLDADTLFLTDKLPPQIAFYNGDIDDGGPQTLPVIMETINSALTFSYPADIGFSTGPTQPANFGDCNDFAPSGYDAAGTLTYICFAPKGIFAFGSPDPSFTFKFRAKIR